MSQHTEYPAPATGTNGRRAAILIALALFFAILLPLAIVALSAALDAMLQLPRTVFPPINAVLAAAAIAAGACLAVWAIILQFRNGKGTPAPVMPTRELVNSGPYAWCRNPMVLGMLVAYFGIGIGLGSLAAVAMVMVAGSVLLGFIYRFEERELERRFGDAYRGYRRSTPFIIPRRPAAGN